MRDIDQAKWVRLLLAIFLPACLIVLGEFYALMFQRDNAAPVVDFADYRTRGTVGFQYRLEECWSNDKKLAASGRVLRERRDTCGRWVLVVLWGDDRCPLPAHKNT